MDRQYCLYLGLLLSLMWTGSAGNQAEPALHKVDDNAILQWNLPESSKADVVTMALQTAGLTQPLFYASTVEAGRIKIDKLYQDKIDVFDSLYMKPALVAFTLKGVTAADAGRYVCISGIGTQPLIEDCGQMLVIVETPEDTTVTTSTAAVEGQDLTLQCTATSTSLPPDHPLPLQVQWFDSNGGQLTEEPGKVRVVGSDLVVSEVRRDDQGMSFSCRASDGLDMWSAESGPYTMVPEYGPLKSDVTISRSYVEINRGQTLWEECSATCNPACPITWERQQPQGDWYTVSSVEHFLHLPIIQRDNGGNYRCRAFNEHGSAWQSFQVVVLYPPNLQVVHINGQKVKKARLTEGANVTVTCQFDSNPAPSVRWFRERDADVILLKENLEDQRPLVSVERGVTRNTYTSQFVQHSVQCSDTGVYICTASNVLGSGLDGEFQLDVVCMPRNTLGDLQLEELYLSPVDTNFQVEFQVEGYPQPEIVQVISEDGQGRRRLEVRGNSWTVSTMTRSTHLYLTTFIFNIPTPTPDYFDRTYYLEFENTEGNKVLAFQLKERGPPKPPRNLTAVWTEDTRVHLFWTAGFYGGKPQTFMVQYQLAGDSHDYLPWLSLPTDLQATEEETQHETTISGLQPGSTYNLRVHAMNEYGNTTSAILTVSTMEPAAAGAGGGVIAAVVVIIIIVLIVVILVVIYIFIIKPRRRQDLETDDNTREPMLCEKDGADGVATVTVEEEKPLNSEPVDTSNNNAHDTDGATELPDDVQKPPPVDGQKLSSIEEQKPSSGDEEKPSSGDEEKCADDIPDDRPRNKDGLVYAALQFDKPGDTPKPERTDAVNYETINFTRSTPQPNLDVIEPASDDREPPTKKQGGDE